MRLTALLVLVLSLLGCGSTTTTHHVAAAASTTVPRSEAPSTSGAERISGAPERERGERG